MHHYTRSSRVCQDPPRIHIQYGIPLNPRRWRLAVERAFPDMTNEQRRIVYALEKQYENAFTHTPLRVLCQMADVSAEDARAAVRWLTAYGFISLHVEVQFPTQQHLPARVHLHAGSPKEVRCQNCRVNQEALAAL